MNNMELDLFELLQRVLQLPGEKVLPLSALTALSRGRKKYVAYVNDSRNYPVLMDRYLAKGATKTIVSRHPLQRSHLVVVDPPDMVTLSDWLKYTVGAVTDVSLVQSVINQPTEVVLRRSDLVINPVVVEGEVLPSIAQAIRRFEEKPAQILMFGHVLGYMANELRLNFIRTLAQHLSPRHGLLLSVDTNVAERQSLEGLYDNLAIREWVLDLWQWFFHYSGVIKSDLEELPVRYEFSYNVPDRQVKVSIVFKWEVDAQGLKIAAGTEVVMFYRRQFELRTLVNSLISAGWQVKSSFSAQYIQWLVCEH